EKSLKFRSWGHRGLAVAKSAPPALDASRAIETGSGERILGQESAQGLDCRARKISLVRVTRRCSIGMPDRPKRHEYVFVFSQEARVRVAQGLLKRAEIYRRELKCNLAHGFLTLPDLFVNAPRFP